MNAAILSRRFWSAPDPLLVAAGFEGEALVARIRLVVTALLLITPLYKLSLDPEYPVYRWGLAIAIAGFSAALTVELLLRFGRHGAWLGFTSSLIDVSFVSSALWTFMFVGSPLVALNSKVTFEIYFLAIGGLALRHDRRVCIVAGTAALAQYGGLVLYARSHFDLDDPVHGALAGLGSYSDVDQLTRLILLAAAVLLAYSLVERSRALLDRSLRDRLTGAFTRTFLERFLEHELAVARDGGRPVSLVALDLDHFKRINDEHGHLVGDDALREFTTTLMWRLRRTELLARYGGEEFVVVLPGVARGPARAVIERIRRAVAQLRVATPAGPIGMSFSAGIAEFPADGADGGALFAAADARLLEAKRAGRDRTVG